MNLNTRPTDCQGRVWAGRGRSHQCTNRPSIGKHCKVHDPETRKAKEKVRDAASAKAREERNDRREAYAIRYGLEHATVEQLKAELRRRKS